MSNILVTGATGQLGKAVTENLLKKANPLNVYGLVRDDAKATDLIPKHSHVKLGDYNDYSSLLLAFKGIDKLYMISGNDLAKRTQQHYNVVDAAVEAGVKHIIYTSFQRKDENYTPENFIAHLHTEDKIKASGLTYTFLKHGIYAEMIPIFAGKQLLQNCKIFLPAKEGKTAYVLRDDLAEAGANILLDESEKYYNTSIELAGSEAFSWGQIAGKITNITGKPIRYVSPTVEDFKEALAGADVLNKAIDLMVGFNSAVADGQFDNINNELKNILGRRPANVGAYLKSIYKNK